ncbi:MAG: M23 family metallopeptidase [Clostridia bacterium]|nr:M23 family metallopeptidase [Clostridia bacterium]
MSEENKKENKNGMSRPDSFDEVIDGLYDLDSIYSKQTKKKPVRSREEELRLKEERLRLKDEKRREFEMQAIKEDIERRYSLQLEDAQSKNEPEKKVEKRTSISSRIMPEIDGHEVVREELEHIDKLINEDNPKKAEIQSAKKTDIKKKKKAKAAEPVEEYDLSDSNAFYSAFYSFGDTICGVVSAVFGFLFKIIGFPFKRMYAAFSRATANTKKSIHSRARNTLKEIVHFRREIKNAEKSIKAALKKPLTIPSVMLHYFKKAFKRHNDLLKTFFNYLMPVAALAVFLVTVNYWNGVTFALEVIYNGQSLGYISDEAVYIEAKDLVKERLDSGAYAESVDVTVAAAPAADLNNAQYSLSLVSLDELNDAQAISDKMIENSVDNLTHACGVYIDGEFICAVKNEADAKTVFNDYIAPYEAEAQSNNYVVSFAETIDYVQGLYRDNASVMWDAARLTNAIKGTSGQNKTHTVTSEDTLAEIAAAYGVSEEYIKTLNPGIDWENIKPGEVLTVEKAENEGKLVSIKKIITSTSVRDIEFETITRRDATKYSGYRQVTQEGVNGSERVIKTQIYIDGVLEDTDYDYETVKEPVDEVVVVGTKTSYNGVYIGSASKKGFLWPAPSCHYVSSAYGWRSRGWHKGIDLVKSGGGALGTPVIASRSGRVEVVQRSNSGYGNMILINHGDGYKTRYAHMVSGSMTVSVGDYVEAGQTIGKVGSTGNSTGPHLHFEVIYNGETYNPANYIY